MRKTRLADRGDQWYSGRTALIFFLRGIYVRFKNFGGGYSMDEEIIEIRA